MPERVTFELDDARRLDRLAALVDALAAAKSTDDFRDEAYWEAFLDDAVRAGFQWPADGDALDRTDQRWPFGAVIGMVQDSEIRLSGLARNGSVASLSFEPLAWPFGGTGWMKALVEGFGGRVVEDTYGDTMRSFARRERSRRWKWIVGIVVAYFLVKGIIVAVSR